MEYWLLSLVESHVMHTRVWCCSFRKAFECHWCTLSTQHAAILQFSLKLSVSALKGSKRICGNGAPTSPHLALLILYWNEPTKISQGFQRNEALLLFVIVPVWWCFPHRSHSMSVWSTATTQHLIFTEWKLDLHHTISHTSPLDAKHNCLQPKFSWHNWTFLLSKGV